MLIVRSSSGYQESLTQSLQQKSSQPRNRVFSEAQTIHNTSPTQNKIKKKLQFALTEQSKSPEKRQTQTRLSQYCKFTLTKPPCLSNLNKKFGVLKQSNNDKNKRNTMIIQKQNNKAGRTENRTQSIYLKALEKFF